MSEALCSNLTSTTTLLTDVDFGALHPKLAIHLRPAWVNLEGGIALVLVRVPMALLHLETSLPLVKFHEPIPIVPDCEIAPRRARTVGHHDTDVDVVVPRYCACMCV